jgi:hypothetical protein
MGWSDHAGGRDVRWNECVIVDYGFLATASPLILLPGKGPIQAAVTLISAKRSYSFLALQTSGSKKALGQDVTRASRCKEVTSHAKVIAGFDHPNSR